MNFKIGSIDSKKKYYLIYSGVFLFCIGLFSAYLLLQGKTNINFVSDGMNQHYRAMLYYSQYIRSIIHNLFVDHSLVIPLWDFSIGEGADIINVLHSDAIGDPLTFLSFLVPERFMPAYYMFNTYIRVYLAGIFFSALCFYIKEDDYYATLIATFVYIFSFWSLLSMVFHIYFLTPFMYFPLLILGVEKIINDDKPYLFVIAVFLSSISWLYFFYMEALGTAIYGFIRLVCKYGKDYKTIIHKLIYILIHAIWGLLMASVVLLPMIGAYMSDSRMSISNTTPLLYPLSFYERLLSFYVSSDTAYDLCMGFVSATLLSLVLVFKDFRKNRTLALLNIVWIVSLLFPMLGKIWNGFSYVSQRWSFIICLPVAYSFKEKWSEYKNNKKLLAISIVIIVLMTLASAWSRTESVFVAIIFCIMFYFLVSTDIRQDLKQVLVLLLIICNTFYIYQYNLSDRGAGFINDLLDSEQANNLRNNYEAAFMKNYMKDEKDFVRYSGYNLTNNAAMTSGTNSTNFYWSITNPNDQLYRLELGLRDHLSWQLNGYDYRGKLETLSNVKYYVAPSWFYNILPYGFEQKDAIDDYLVFENRYALPFGYTYSNSLSYDKWHELSGVEKQEAMLERIVVEEGNTDYSSNNISELTYTVKTNGNISYENGLINVEDKDAYLILELNGNSNVENYLSFYGLQYDDVYGVLENDQTDAQVIIETSYEKISYFAFASKNHRYYYGKDYFVSYLGCSEQPLTQLKISFSLPGQYSFEKLVVNSVDLTDYQNKIDLLKDEHLENVTFEANLVKGSINLKQDKYLLMSIPYSKGWSAKVDGENVELLRANEHYMALKLDKGFHTIELNYMTPNLKTGSIISLLSIGLFIFIVSRKKEKQS